MYIDGLKIGVTHQSHRPYPEMPDERPHEVPDFFSFRLNQQPFHDIALCSCRAWALDRCDFQELRVQYMYRYWGWRHQGANIRLTCTYQTRSDSVYYKGKAVTPLRPDTHLGFERNIARVTILIPQAFQDVTSDPANFLGRFIQHLTPDP
jgi:hypothetical protein